MIIDKLFAENYGEGEFITEDDVEAEDNEDIIYNPNLWHGYLDLGPLRSSMKDVVPSCEMRSVITKHVRVNRQPFHYVVEMVRFI